MNSDMEHMKTCRTTYTSLKYSIRELKTNTYTKYLSFFLIWRKNKDPTYVFYNIKQGSSSVLISFPYLIIRLFIHGIYYSNIFNNWSATLYYWTMEKGSIIYLLMTLLPYWRTYILISSFLYSIGEYSIGHNQHYTQRYSKWKKTTNKYHYIIA